MTVPKEAKPATSAKRPPASRLLLPPLWTYATGVQEIALVRGHSTFSQMKTDYPSRVDWWIAGMLVGGPLLVLLVGAFTLTRSIAAGVVTISAGLVIGGLIAAISVPCVYTLSDDGLKIKAGMFEDEVPLRKIRGAEKSGSIWSAPALSLRRVKITLEDGSRVISPEDRDKFMADLDARLRAARKS